MLAGDVTVSVMLGALRSADSPTTDSPAMGAGDPADGDDNAIGAIGDGSDDQDRFGTFGR